MGDLRQCTKSDRIGCDESLITAPQNDMPEVDAKIVDGSVVVNMFPPKTCATFGDYAATLFVPYVLTLADFETLRCCMGPLHRRKS